MAIAERAALPPLGETVAGKYRLECVIGSGGMSVVFGTTHVVTGKRFAIKWLAPAFEGDRQESVQRFICEAQVAGRFQHPNVVEVYDVGQTREGAHFMLMEWLDGEALSARLERTGALSLHDACAYLIPCMRAIEDAHAAGIVHRDLKPANIFICQATKHGPERAKVLDFGIAKMAAITPGDISPVLTQKGTMMGTPYYLAPEQLRQLPVDARADVYAFGVILYQVLTGNLPFYAENFAELVLQIATGTPPLLCAHAPELGEEIEAVVARAMAREPAERFQDMRALIEALEHARGQGMDAPLAAGRRRARLGVGLAVLVGAAVLIGWYVNRSHPPLNAIQAATAAELAPSHAAALDAPQPPPPAAVEGRLGETSPPPSAATAPPGQNSKPPSAAASPPGKNLKLPSAAAAPPGENSKLPSAAASPPGKNLRPPSAAAAPPGENSKPPSAAASPPGEHLRPLTAAVAPPSDRAPPPSTAEVLPADRSPPPSAAEPADLPTGVLPPQLPTPAVRRPKRAAPPEEETPPPAAPHNPLRMRIQ